jgi:hypothetical protein
MKALLTQGFFVCEIFSLGDLRKQVGGETSLYKKHFWRISPKITKGKKNCFELALFRP